MKDFFKENTVLKVMVIVLLLGGGSYAMYSMDDAPAPKKKLTGDKNRVTVVDKQSGDTTAEKTTNLTVNVNRAQQALKTATKEIKSFKTQMSAQDSNNKREVAGLKQEIQKGNEAVANLSSQMSAIMQKLSERPSASSRNYVTQAKPTSNRKWNFEDAAIIYDEKGKPIPPMSQGMLPNSTTPVYGSNEVSPLPAKRLLGAGANKTGDVDTALVPFGTIPDGATLYNGMAMSALIGRIPIRGTVPDAYRFKAIIGAENLAANGIEIPNIEGVIAQGILKGDMLMSCSRGEIDTMTFVFQDGTISTTKSAGNSKKEALGFISDVRGNPCITGEFFTNAPRAISTFSVLGGIEAAGKVYTKNQQTIVGTTSGATVEAFTGDEGKAVVGSMFSEAGGEAKKWYASHIENSYDAVYTSAGVNLTMNITSQINIDYDPQGRKVSYGLSSGSAPVMSLY